MMAYVKLGAATVVAALLTFTHVYVYNAGKNMVLAQLKDQRIEVLKDGKKIDAEVLASDDSGLCVMLGGCELPVGVSD